MLLNQYPQLLGCFTVQTAVCSPQKRFFCWWPDFNPLHPFPTKNKQMPAAEVKLNQLYLMANREKRHAEWGLSSSAHYWNELQHMKGREVCKWKRQADITGFFPKRSKRELLDSCWQVPSDLLLETLMIKVITPDECLITLNITSRFNSDILVSSTFCHRLVQELRYLNL